AHVAAADRRVVEVDVDAVVSGRHEIAAFEARQVGGVLARAGEHAAVEVGIRRVGRGAGVGVGRGSVGGTGGGGQRQQDRQRQPTAGDCARAGRRCAGACALHGVIVPWLASAAPKSLIVVNATAVPAAGAGAPSASGRRKVDSGATMPASVANAALPALSDTLLNVTW